MIVNTLKAELIQQLRNDVAREAKRYTSLKFGGKTDTNLHSIAATLSVLTHMREAARMRPLVAADVQDCIREVLAATGVEEYSGPMGEAIFRYAK